MAETTKRRLGTLDVACVVVGAIVGVGVFFTPARVAARAGGAEAALWVWVVGGAVALLGALTFAELGGRLPEAGGQFRVLLEAFGARTAFVYVIVVGVVESSAAVAILALVCVDHIALAAGVPRDPATGAPNLDPALLSAGACALVLGAFALTAAGVRQGATALNLNVAVKLAVVATLVGVGFAHAPAAPAAAPSAPAAPGSGGAAGFVAAFLPAFFAYGGWQQSLWIGGEVRDPGRSLPRGILLGTVVVIVAYLGLNVAYLRLLGFEGVAASKTVAASAASAAHPDAGRWIAAAVAWSALGCVQTILFTGPHQLAALARKGYAPERLGAANARGAPVAAAAAFAATALLLVVLAGPKRIGLLLDAVVCVDWIFFALTGAALFVLRRRADLPLPFRTPGYPVVPAVFVLAAAGIAASPFFDAESRPSGLIALGAVGLVALAAGRATRRTRGEAPSVR